MVKFLNRIFYDPGFVMAKPNRFVQLVVIRGCLSGVVLIGEPCHRVVCIPVSAVGSQYAIFCIICIMVHMRAVVAGIRHGKLKGHRGFPVEFPEQKRADAGDQIAKSGIAAGGKVKAIPNRIGHRIGCCICGDFFRLKTHLHRGNSRHPVQ